MTYLQLLHTLRERSGGGSKYGLDRMRELLAALQHPEQRFPSWLIAGTNGKGSVCAMLEAIALAQGERTGMNTSPHLNRTTERIRISGVEITQQQMLDVFAHVEEARLKAGLEATFFETMTAMAFCHFAHSGVTRAVVEVGLGGRLDATNLLPCELSCVVSIGYDHTRILGSTLAEIAGEKAAVGRPDRPLILGMLPPEALQSALQKAQEIGAKPVLVADHLRRGSPSAVEHPRGRVKLAPSLGGAHQVENAAVAALLALEAGIEVAVIEQGLANARWRGRLEALTVNCREYLLDSAHNIDGAQALGISIEDRVSKGYDLVVASTGTRNTGAFVEALADRIGWPRTVRTCRPSGHRVAAADEVAQRVTAVLPQNVPLKVCDSVEQALFAEQGGGDAPLCLVTGSMFLVGEALAVLDQEERDPFETGR